MKVKDYYKFKLYEYQNFFNTNFELGDVLINIEHLDDLANFGNPIGVVIQTHLDGDCRTDMYGNTCIETSRLATLEEIGKYRAELLSEL